MLCIWRVAKSLGEACRRHKVGGEESLLFGKPLLPGTRCDAVCGSERVVVCRLVLEALEQRLFDVAEEVWNRAIWDGFSSVS